MTANSHDESERQTRRQRIDPALTRAGWVVAPFVEGAALPQRPTALAEFPTATGPADYLLAADGVPLAVVEAKRLTVGAGGVLTQAERYARGLAIGPHDFDGLRVPFLYSTNGEVTRFHDARHPLNTSRVVATFHTPNALRELLADDFAAGCARLLASPNDHECLRPYQREANAAIETAVAERKRELLLAMATGTGKTLTLVNQIYRLIKSGVARRVLFLVDRRALAAQAVRAFASFDPEPNLKFSSIYPVYSQRFQAGDFDADDGKGDRFDPTTLPNGHLADPQRKHTFVYVCTVQRMAVNLFGRGAVLSDEGDDLDDDDQPLENLPIHGFDVVVADECHRGYTSQAESLWRGVLNHFDAIRIGLTATPTPSTKSYFTHKVFAYGYPQAVAEGFLVDYDVVTLKSDVRLEGVELKEGEQVQYVDPATGNAGLFDTMEDRLEFSPAELERKVTSRDSNRKILEELKRHADEHVRQHGRFPKTLVFAVHDLPHVSHADALVSMAQEVFGRGESFVRKITGRTDRPLQWIKEFRNRQNLGIVVSVDLMSTGVDIPDLEFLVFLRPVRSRVLWEQMIGRGTRLGKEFPDKSHFVVVDCFDGALLKAFKAQSEMTAEAPLESPRTLAEIIEDIWANRNRDYNARVLVKRLHRIDKQMAAEARPLFAAFGIAEGDVAKYAAGLAEALRRDFVGAMALLRNPAFQKLLLDYPRPKPTFMVALENEDDVSSEYLFRDAAGQALKPADYLAEFSRFVRENPERIEAIRILLERPRGWNVQALKELRHKLAATPQRFTPANLERAHRLRFDKALVDIISMVKHAAQDAEPLLTALERVDRALAVLTAGRELTDAQRGWLERIRDHLAENLSIEADDFDLIPTFADAGGWGAADRTFGGKLAELLVDLNAALAA